MESKDINRATREAENSGIIDASQDDAQTSPQL